jgi:type I restriction enzyme S subunit
MTWPAVKLGDVLRPTAREDPVDRSATYRLLGVRLEGEGPFLREEKSGSAISATKLARVRTGDFIYSRLFAWRGAFGVIPKELGGCHVSAEFPTFEAVPGRVDLNFLRWWFRLRETLRAVEAECSGSTPLTRNRLKEERFLALTIPLPPLAEQRRIVARIEAIARELQDARHLRDDAGNHLAGILDAASAALIDGHAWPEQRLSDLLAEDTLNGISAKPADTADGLAILRISAATSRADATVDESDIKYLPFDPHLRVKYGLLPGDLLACRFNGNLHFVGRFALFQGLEGPRVFPDKLIRFRFNNGVVCPWFMRYAANTRKRRSVIEALCATTAGNIGISAARLKAVPVAVPPLPDQHRIVAYLDGLQAKVDALKALQVKTAAELDALMPSILDKAFRGEL